MKQYVTRWLDEQPVLQQLETSLYPDDQQESNILNLYPEMQFQPIMGFGGAFTEAAGSVLEKMPRSVQAEILEAYYGQDGLGYTMARTHIDSCDFSLGNHCAVTDPEDTEFATMNLAHEERYILPYLLQAQKIAGRDIRMLLAPWSPPAFMKTNNERNGGGSLKPEYYAAWAKYMATYLSAMQQRGLFPYMVSTQNEPKAVQTWDSCVYTAQEESTFLRDFLNPALKAAGLPTGITIWDHNKERLFDRSQSILRDPETDAAVAGIAFHWYSGDHFEAIALTRAAHPDKLLFFTEGCVEYSRFSKGQLPNAQMYAHDMIGNLNAGMNAFLDWNLVLDQEGGPNHVHNYCDAPIMCDTLAGTYERKLSYHYIGHFSHYIQPGAVRIGKTCYTDTLETCAFQNPDGSLVCVILNRNERDIPCTVRINQRVCSCVAPASSISTLTLSAEEIA